MELTAMQELITHLEMLKSRVDMVDVDSLIEYATTSLEKEKEQITKAYNSAIPFKFGEEYYNQKYNDTTR